MPRFIMLRIETEDGEKGTSMMVDRCLLESFANPDAEADYLKQEFSMLLENIRHQTPLNRKHLLP